MAGKRSQALGAAIWAGFVCIGAGALALGMGRADRPAAATLQPDARPHGGPESSPVSFGQDVRPILVSNCLVCHGFDPSTREAGLRLDNRADATSEREDGRPPAIVPGRPDQSLLVRRITAHDDSRMPPEGEALSDAEIEILRRWIAEGAAYERHWSLRPVASPPVPRVAEPRWSANPIDAFVRTKQAEAGLEPSPRADRRTLIRRLSFDLTGLPPTPEEVEAFASDTSESAYEQLVDRLLASPRFGERWARHWLDLMRYAETYAHEYDYPIRHAWRYRDYVIRALNADVPYDQFVTEHIAGDLLDSPRRHPEEGTNESIIGTSFWWLSQGTHAPVDVLLDEADRIDNQLDVLSKAFMATTLSCARCHDHKFDPILTREYYGLTAFIKSSRRQEAYLDPGGNIDAAAREMDRLQASAASWYREEGLSSLVPSAEETARLLLASAEAIHGEPQPGERPASVRDRIFDNFDDGTYDKWTMTGEAFADGPAEAKDAPLHGQGTAKGAFLLNTHREVKGRDTAAIDALVGKLESPEFTIEHDFLHFLIGGGNHPGRTGLHLVVDGEVVRSATGRNGHTLRPVRFDLRELRGKSARIEIIDEATGGWGNTAIDEIVLSDEARRDRPAKRSIDAVARTSGIEPAILRDWVNTLQDVPEDDAADPLAPWARAAAHVGGGGNAPIGDALAVDETDRSAGQILEDFDADSLGDWFETGWAFDRGVSNPGDVLGPDLSLCDAACVDSGAVSQRLQGTLRSPTFEITHPYLATRARGKGYLRVIVEGYTMDEYNPLLFERTRILVDSPSWSWHVHDVRKWIGRRAHYEIIDDDGYGAIGVDRLVFMDEDRAPSERPWTGRIAELLGEDPTLAELAGVYGGALDRVREGEGDSLGLALANRLAAVDPDDLDAGAADALEQLARLEGNLPAPQRVFAMEDGTPEQAHVYVRGDHRQQGEPAPRTFLSAYCDDPSLDISAGSGRPELAHKLLDESNPLPARVMVNRIWHHLFGRGIVETTDDFGLQGTSPTHPELLDHLATRFRSEMDWSIKTLIREIVLSETYRMACGPMSERTAIVDPNNELFSVREPRRLDGESIRDAVLAISGRLDETMYGPSVPIHLTGFMTGRGRPGRSGPLDGAGRRSIYQEVRRNFPSPMMQAFDTPNPHSTIGKRSVSNVPAQSLILLNDPFVVQQAELLAKRLLREAEAPADRVGRLYELVLSRSPTPSERDAALAFVESQAQSREAEGSEDAEAAAWTDLSHVMFNLKEFVFLR